ncbi:MAG: tRNA1(Val) (adenine(37)-N6)-methyltransferase, partial [Saprospiraceae bacterium]
MKMNEQKIVEEKPFYFKEFVLQQKADVMKVGTDGILLGAWVDTTDAKHILDIGTGTGMIAVMCAQKNKKAKVDAVDIEEAAYKLASLNTKACEWSERLGVFHGSIQEFSKVRDIKYDLIVSNPPFFTGGTFSQNSDRNHMRHTIKLPNGELLQAVRRLLIRDGRFCVILPYLEGLRFKEQAEQYGFFCTRKTAVRPTPNKEIERLLLEFRFIDNPTQEEELIVENNNMYTDAFVCLTKAFYR